MRGTMLILRPCVATPERRSFDREPTLEELQAAVGGYIEIVPHFHTIGFAGHVERCVVLCNEEGKLKDLPLNVGATNAWATALLRAGLPGAPDVLLGNVAVLFGDPEFMEAL